MFYTVVGDGIKMHFCDSWILTQQVIENLTARFKNTKLTVRAADLESNVYRFDVGGSLYKPGSSLDFNVGGAYRIACYAFHWDSLYDAVTTATSNKYDNKFYKLHGYYSILCMSPDSFEHLRNYITLNKSFLDAEAQRILGS